MLSDTPQELTLTATTPLMSVATSESVGVMNEHMSRFEVIGQQSKTEFHMEYTRPFKRPRPSEIVATVGMPVVANRAIICNIFKTKMCEQFRLGCCIYGDKCSFAHGIGDIRKPVSPCQRLVQEDHSVKVWDEEPRMINRMKLCRIFYRGGICPYGDRCLFLHGGPEKLKENSGRLRQSFTKSMAATGSSRGNRTGSDSTCRQRSVSDHVVECKGSVNLSLDDDRLHSKPIYWKTKLCNKWVTTGDCYYGEKCVFAHGKAELKNLGRYFASDSGKAHITATQMTLANEASPGETTTNSSYKWQVQSKKCLFKLKELEKISGIYADWIDDIPLVHSLPNKIQT